MQASQGSAHRGDWHQHGAAYVSGLPLHPIHLRSLNHPVALATGYLRLHVYEPKEISSPKVCFKQRAMEVHVAILMSKRGPQAILPPVVLGQVPRNSDDGLSSRLELRDPVDVRPMRAQVSILVQIPSLVFDQRL